MSDRRLPDKTYSKTEIDKIVQLRQTNGNEVELVCIDDVEPENQPWLWHGVIPLDAFTLFAGVGGLGKSQLLMFIAARVSDGKSFKAGGVEYTLPQGSVLILSSEDSQKYALSPRLRALGADTSKIHKIKSVINAKDRFKRRLMALDEDLQLLKLTLTQLKEKSEAVKLIIIDPIINFIGKTKDYVNTEVSNFLFSLTDLAEEFNLAIILNKHLRKKDSSGAGSAVDEVSGSHAWVNTARQVWIICRDHEDKKKILFLDGKSNIKEQMTGLAFNIQTAQVLNKKCDIINTSCIAWLDEVVTLTPDEAVNEEKYQKSKVQLAVDFIINHLRENGQSVFKILSESAVKSGIKLRTFEEAAAILRKDDRVEITNGTYPNKNWMLKK